jgi:DNA-binding Lrp family transcriptional regulator
MAEWWDDIEQEILGCLEGQGPTAPAAIARRLRMSETSATSLLAALAREGKVRICLVERPPTAWRQARADEGAATR